MGASKIDRLCQSVLPPEFEQVKRRLPKIQHFLEQNLPEPVNRAVTLLTIKPDEIVIAANSPLVANYLRLHAGEIQQQLRESFGLQQSLRFRTIPDSMLKIDSPETLRKPGQTKPESIEALQRNAQWIEDDDLRAAILSLADSLKAE